MTTKEDIEALSLDNPLVYKMMTEYFNGHISWENALGEMVKFLIEENRNLKDLLKNCVENTPNVTLKIKKL